VGLFGKDKTDKALSDSLRKAVEAIEDPNTGQPLGDAVLEAEVRSKGDARVHVRLGYPAAGYRETLERQVGEAAAALEGVGPLQVTVDWKIEAHRVQRTLRRFDEVPNVIALASGKGGGGKSTTAVNLALALQAEGGRVGILDADIYGPSQPRMLGVEGQRPESPDGKSLKPVMAHGLQSMSIGYLIDEDTPMVWRGPMVTQALQQLLNDTRWDDLDYLIVDMPPGTGDTQLTLSQKVPVAGAVIVTTPQDIALLDAKKGLRMFEKVEVPVLGIVENMSLYVCPQCGHEEHIFGEGGGESMADEYGVNFLGSLPLNRRIREQADGGNPTVAADPECQESLIYREVARRTAAALALKAKDYSTKFPKIVIEED